MHIEHVNSTINVSNIDAGQTFELDGNIYMKIVEQFINGNIRNCVDLSNGRICIVHGQVLQVDYVATVRKVTGP